MKGAIIGDIIGSTFEGEQERFLRSSMI